MYKRLFSLIVALFIVNATYAQEEAWMPDPALREAVRATLEIPEGIPLNTNDMQRLYTLISNNETVQNLEGIQHATNLEYVQVVRCQISNLTPIAKLQNLRILQLYKNKISDLTPLSGLMGLEKLGLEHNQITDISPLANLKNLMELTLHNNRITDFSPLAGLTNLRVLTLEKNLSVDISSIPQNLIEFFTYDASCDLERSWVTERITNRDYPSVAGVWGDIINLPTLPGLQKTAYHDLYAANLPMLDLRFIETEKGIYVGGQISRAIEEREILEGKNPDFVLLAVINYYSGISKYDHSEYFPYLLKDEKGNLVIDDWDEVLLDFTLPQTQDWVIQQVAAISKCGLFDGIFLDHWTEDRRLKGYRTLEEEHTARDAILKSIRDVVGDNFLIMANSNNSKIPRWASYVNGIFMETLPSHFTNYKTLDYTNTDILEMEKTLLWSEEHLREPRINALETWVLANESPDSSRNLQWMRFFTSMSLTHSNGYILFAIGNRQDFVDSDYHSHYWYPFWDADLGQPVGEKAQLYKNQEGLFIREFTNGWAVYNRSGKTQQIRLPEKASGVTSGMKGKRSHVLPDLDGEIYLKSELGLEILPTADVNGDGIVNILDLVVVANAFGKDTPDVNGDGTVNVLDLVAVANAFE